MTIRPQNQTWRDRNTAREQQQWRSVDQYGNVRVCYKCGQEGHIASFCPQASMGNQRSTGYYQHGQGSSSQRSQLPTQQQKFNQQKSAQQPQSGKSWGGKQPQYQNHGKQQPAAGGRMFALQEEEDTDPSAIQVTVQPPNRVNQRQETTITHLENKYQKTTKILLQKEVVNEAMERVPILKELVDYYSGPDRVTAKKQHEELERVAKTLPKSAPASVKRFTQHAVLSLQVGGCFYRFLFEFSIIHAKVLNLIVST
ncbi:hypothetical protein Vadar_001121 [Vaccinium darrowii]|uniref:Uncharacterized protein n=1 Tax=Vaccinium darrowii TaxID=229202 RepID=A0ACB7Z0W6_9ERIC|nr:hypothetical protein Vadar_001121 [Vaccinium darrowii]